MKYRQIYEAHHKIKIPVGMHIHHIDGNHSNNSIDNLEMLTPDEHAKKHGFLSNFIMARSTAQERANIVLRRPEIREKMSNSMKNSAVHKEAIAQRSTDLGWLERVSAACRITAANRTNPTPNKGQRGKKWYNDGIRTFQVFPVDAKEAWVFGRLKWGKQK